MHTDVRTCIYVQHGKKTIFLKIGDLCWDGGPDAICLHFTHIVYILYKKKRRKKSRQKTKKGNFKTRQKINHIYKLCTSP